MVDLEKRFYFSPDGGRLNVSAGLPVPEGRFEFGSKEPSANRHGSNCLITSHDLQLLPADGKWRFAVRPIHIAVGDPRPLEAG